MGGRTSIRVKVTLLYGGMFFLAGALLILAGYLFVQHALDAGITELGNSPLFNLAHKLLPNKPVLLDRNGTPITADEFRAQLVAEQQQLQSAALRTLLFQALAAGGVVAVLAVCAGWLMAGRVLRPLHLITATARGVAERSLGERINLTGPQDELKELADTFDAMLERLDRAFDGQRRFVANASHELRTPLTISRTLIQVAMGRPDVSPDLRELGGALLDVNTKQRELTDGLLALAQSTHSLDQRSVVDLADVAGEAVESVAAAGQAAGIAVHVDGEPAMVLGDRVLLVLLARNLVANAVRYNRPDGWVRVTTGHDASTAWLTVANTGPPVSADAVEQIFEPFRRLGAARAANGTGHGLGLSIVRSVARAHDGEASARPRTDGGLTVRVVLPDQDAAGTSATSDAVMPALRTTPPPTTSTAG
jgi:signal transduction histidine kinase